MNFVLMIMFPVILWYLMTISWDLLILVLLWSWIILEEVLRHLPTTAALDAILRLSPEALTRAPPFPHQHFENCQQYIARCYLHLWCYFIPITFLIVTIITLSSSPTPYHYHGFPANSHPHPRHHHHHHHPDTLTQYPPSSSTRSSTHRQIVVGHGAWVWSTISHSVSFYISVPNSF